MCVLLPVRRSGGAPIRRATAVFRDSVVPLFCMCANAYAYRAVQVPQDEVLGFAMVTKVISVRDPRCVNDVKLHKAIQAEFDNVMSHDTWNPELIREWPEVKAENPKAERIRAHLIAGSKHAETPHLSK